MVRLGFVTRLWLNVELSSRVRERLQDQPIGIVCLGLGKCFADRTAQIQTALLLLLISDLQVRRNACASSLA